MRESHVAGAERFKVEGIVEAIMEINACGRFERIQTAPGNQRVRDAFGALPITITRGDSKSGRHTFKSKSCDCRHVPDLDLYESSHVHPATSTRAPKTRYRLDAVPPRKL